MYQEQTIFDSEDNTSLDGEEIMEEPEKEEKEERKGRKDSPMWHAVTIGGVSGIIFGAFASGLKADTAVPGQMPQEDTAEVVNVEQPGETIVDDGVAEAMSVGDGMSFSEAFASARAEVGPGGVFEWRGNLYGTYYATEWDSMTAEEKNEYSSHVRFIDDGQAVSSDLAEVEEVEVVSASFGEDSQVAVVEAEDAVQVEVLGVEYDEESGMNVAYVNVDDQEVILVDTTGDEVFDYLATDVNHDSQITPDEVIDISGEGLTVDALGGFTDDPGADDMLAFECGI